MNKREYLEARREENRSQSIRAAVIVAALIVAGVGVWFLRLYLIANDT